MKCFVCGNENLKLIGKNLSFPECENYACNYCQVCMIAPVPSFKKIEEFYQDGYCGVQDNNPTSMEMRLKFSEKRASSQFQLIQKYLSWLQGSEALDVGCSDGSLLLMLHRHNFRVAGYEPDRKMAEFANRRISPNENLVKNVFFEEDSNIRHKSYDLVCSSNVFEHVADPAKHLDKIKNVLKPNGILFMEIPNEYQMAADFWQINQSVYPVSAKEHGHLFFYSTNSIKMVLENNGYDILYIGTCGEDMGKILNFSPIVPMDKPSLSVLYQNLLSNPQLFTNYWQGGKEGVWIRIIASLTHRDRSEIYA